MQVDMVNTFIFFVMPLSTGMGVYAPFSLFSHTKDSGYKVLLMNQSCTPMTQDDVR